MLYKNYCLDKDCLGKKITLVKNPSMSLIQVLLSTQTALGYLFISTHGLQFAIIKILDLGTYVL